MPDSLILTLTGQVDSSKTDAYFKKLREDAAKPVEVQVKVNTVRKESGAYRDPTKESSSGRFIGQEKATANKLENYANLRDAGDSFPKFIKDLYELRKTLEDLTPAFARMQSELKVMVQTVRGSATAWEKQMAALTAAKFGVQEFNKDAAIQTAVLKKQQEALLATAAAEAAVTAEYKKAVATVAEQKAKLAELTTTTTVATREQRIQLEVHKLLQKEQEKMAKALAELQVLQGKQQGSVEQMTRQQRIELEVMRLWNVEEEKRIKLLGKEEAVRRGIIAAPVARGSGGGGGGGDDAVRANTRLAGSWHVTNQAATAFRATLQGLQANIGMYTSSTIIVAAASYKLMEAIKSTITVGAEFTAAMSQSRAIMESTGTQYSALESEVIRLGESTRLTTTEVAKGLIELGQAGLKTEEAIAALGPTLLLSIAGSMDFAKAADIATNAMVAFNLQAKDLAGVVDILAQAAVDSNVTVQQIGTTMSYAAPVAEAYNLALTEVVATIEMLGNAGIAGSRAGTTLRRTIESIYTPTKKGAEALESLGVSSNDAFGQTKPLSRVLLDLSDATNGATKDLDKLQDIVGLYALPGFLRLISGVKGVKDEFGNTTKSLAQFEERLKEAVGSARVMAAVISDNLTGDLKELQSAAEAFQLKMFKDGESTLRSMAKAVTEGIRAFSKLPNSIELVSNAIKELAKDIGLLIGAGALFGLLNLLLKINRAMVSLAPVAVATGAAIAGVEVAAAAAATGVGLFSRALGLLAAHPVIRWMALLGSALALLWPAFDDTTKAAGAMYDSLDEGSAVVDKAAKSIKDLATVHGRFIEELEAPARVFVGLVDQYQKEKQLLEELIDKRNTIVATYGEEGEAFIDINKQIGARKEVLASTASAVMRMAKTLEEQRKLQGDLVDKSAEHGRAVDDVNQKLENTRGIFGSIKDFVVDIGTGLHSWAAEELDAVNGALPVILQKIKEAGASFNQWTRERLGMGPAPTEPGVTDWSNKGGTPNFTGGREVTTTAGLMAQIAPELEQASRLNNVLGRKSEILTGLIGSKERRAAFEATGEKAQDAEIAKNKELIQLSKQYGGLLERAEDLQLKVIAARNSPEAGTAQGIRDLQAAEKEYAEFSNSLNEDKLRGMERLNEAYRAGKTPVQDLEKIEKSRADAAKAAEKAVESEAKKSLQALVLRNNFMKTTAKASETLWEIDVQLAKGGEAKLSTMEDLNAAYDMSADELKAARKTLVEYSNAVDGSAESLENLKTAETLANEALGDTKQKKAAITALEDLRATYDEASAAAVFVERSQKAIKEAFHGLPNEAELTAKAMKKVNEQAYLMASPNAVDKTLRQWAVDLQNLDTVGADWLNRFKDAVVDFASGAKGAFKSFFEYVKRSIVEIGAKQIMISIGASLGLGGTAGTLASGTSAVSQASGAAGAVGGSSLLSVAGAGVSALGSITGVTSIGAGASWTAGMLGSSGLGATGTIFSAAGSMMTAGSLGTVMTGIGMVMPYIAAALGAVTIAKKIFGKKPKVPDLGFLASGSSDSMKFEDRLFSGTPFSNVGLSSGSSKVDAKDFESIFKAFKELDKAIAETVGTESTAKIKKAFDEMGPVWTDTINIKGKSEEEISKFAGSFAKDYYTTLAEAGAKTGDFFSKVFLKEMEGVAEGPFEDVMQSITEKIAAISEAFKVLDNYVNSDIIRDYNAEIEKANRSISETGRVLKDDIHEAMREFDGSLEDLQEIARLTAERYAYEMKVLAFLRDSVREIADTAANLKEQMLLDVLEDEEKYKYYKKLAEQSYAKMIEASDPEEIRKYALAAMEYAGQAWGILPDELKKALRPGFDQFVDSLVTDSGLKMDEFEAAFLTDSERLRGEIGTLISNTNTNHTAVQIRLGEIHQALLDLNRKTDQEIENAQRREDTRAAQEGLHAGIDDRTASATEDAAASLRVMAYNSMAGAFSAG